MSLKTIITAILAVGTFGACASSPTTEEEARALRYDSVLNERPYNLLVTYRGDVGDICEIPTGTIYFEYNSNELDSQDITVLTMISSCVKFGSLTGRKVLLTGFTDYVGEYGPNQELAMARSKAAANWLVREGVPADQIFIRAYGERGASYPSNGALDRKVMLTLIESEEL